MRIKTKALALLKSPLTPRSRSESSADSTQPLQKQFLFDRSSEPLRPGAFGGKNRSETKVACPSGRSEASKPRG
jgi:hypothetical protein